MPNRILKDSINESRSLAQVSLFANDLFKRLITYADDYGRFNADLNIIRARLYPFDVDSIEVGDIEEWISELIHIGKVSFYKATADIHPPYKIFGYLTGWANHQRIRNSRKKYPEPEEHVNDWYMQRFIPIEMKLAIAERDRFTCQECKRDFSMPGYSARATLRMLYGALHFDHVVSVKQGGRATLENIRLLCAGCNKKRPKAIPICDLQQLAATCGDLRPKAAVIQSNPIQSNPTPPKAVDEKLAKAYSLWENNMGPLGTITAQRIADSLQEYGLPAFEKAVERTVDQKGKGAPWNYFVKVLSNHNEAKPRAKAPPDARELMKQERENARS